MLGGGAGWENTYMRHNWSQPISCLVSEDLVSETNKQLLRLPKWRWEESWPLPNICTNIRHSGDTRRPPFLQMSRRAPTGPRSTRRQQRSGRTPLSGGLAAETAMTQWNNSCVALNYSSPDSTNSSGRVRKINAGTNGAYLESQCWASETWRQPERLEKEIKTSEGHVLLWTRTFQRAVVIGQTGRAALRTFIYWIVPPSRHFCFNRLTFLVLGRLTSVPSSDQEPQLQTSPQQLAFPGGNLQEYRTVPYVALMWHVGMTPWLLLIQEQELVWKMLQRQRTVICGSAALLLMGLDKWR